MGFISKQIQSYGANSQGKAYIKFHFECDSPSDLPTQSQFESSDNLIVAMGSTAHTITDNKHWEMKSSGTWVDMTNAPSTYDASDIIYDNTESGMTATNVQDAIDELNTDLSELTVLTDEDRASLIELVDGSDKNKFTKPSDSVSSTGSWSETSGLTDITAGIQYVMSFENLDSSDTDGTTIQIRFSNPDLSYEFYRQCQRGQNVRVSFTPQQNITNVRIYKADSYAHGDGDTMSFSGAMICSEAAWKISQSFQPYRPSYQELSDDVDALENGSFVGIELRAGDDLNNLSRGRYYCRSASVSAQILNNPNTGSGFVLDQMYNGNVVQMLYPVSSSNTIIYKRSYASGAWRPWCMFTGTEVT